MSLNQKKFSTRTVHVRGCFIYLFILTLCYTITTLGYKTVYVEIPCNIKAKHKKAECIELKFLFNI